jgi:hypothetical protein
MSGRGLALVSIQAAGLVSVLRNMCAARRGGFGEKLASASRLPAALKSGLFGQETADCLGRCC